MNPDKVFIIAEIGVNHNGDIETAKKMIEVASKMNVDAVKFQSFKAETLVTKNAAKAEYQKKNSGSGDTQFEMLKKLEINDNDHTVLLEHCKKNNVEFLSSPFDLDSIDLLNSLGMRIFKIPSGEINNVPYLKKIASLNKDVILSTGMSSLAEIEFALTQLIEGGLQRKKITVLHCNTAYPTPIEDVNLNAMLTIKNAFQVKVGYSDHTLGIEVPIAAVALGAKVIEKHYTLDKDMIGPDHKASLSPDELDTMVKSIRNIEKSLGSGIKIPSNSEKKNIPIAKKSIVAAEEIKKGDIFTETNITIKRPAGGINPMRWFEIVGKKSNTNFHKDDLIEF